MGHYCYLNADILTIVLQKCSLSSPLPNILFLSKPLNLIGCPGNRKAKPHLPPSPQKNHLLRSHKGNKAETLKKCFLLLLVKCFHCYSNFKNSSLAYNGKRENWYLLPSHCRYFDKGFTEMFPFLAYLSRRLTR